jgi:hypothetical protein
MDGDRVIRRDGDALPFAFVGCWNRRGPARDAVIAAMRADPVAQHLTVLGGDNYYDLGKDPVTKAKSHDPSVITEGFDALKELPVILAFGNHNIEKADGFDAEALERAAAAAAGWIAGDGPERYYEVAYDDVCFTVLDTNLCAPDQRPAFEAMMVWLQARVATKAPKSYYVIQHEPIVAARTKKEVSSVISLPFGDEILAALQKSPPIAILSADTHNWHIVGLMKPETGPPVLQIVVGTGGARPDITNWEDPVYANPQIPVADFGGAVRVCVTPPKTEERDRYGYLQVHTPSSIRFVPVGEPQRGGKRKGGRRRTRKISHSR